MTTRERDPLITVGEYPLERGAPTCPSCGAIPVNTTVHIYSEVIAGREHRVWTWKCPCDADVRLVADRLAPRFPQRVTDKMTGIWEGPHDVTIARGAYTLEEMRKLADG